jgi:hypothetical protein
LEHEKILSQQKGQDLYYTTGDKDKFEKVASELTKKEITAEHVNL